MKWAVLQPVTFVVSRFALLCVIALCTLAIVSMWWLLWLTWKVL